MVDINLDAIITWLVPVAGAVSSPFVAKAIVKFIQGAKVAKLKLSQLRELVDELDDDFKDNHLTDAEYRNVVTKAKRLFSDS